MNAKEIMAYALTRLQSAGAQKAQADLRNSEKSELNVESGAISLFRTTTDSNLTLTAFVEGRKGSIHLNKIDRETIAAAAKEAFSLALASEPDLANDISPVAPAKTFGYGEMSPDSGVMYDRLKEFLCYASTAFPITRMAFCLLDFTNTVHSFGNSNNVLFEETLNLYHFSADFVSKKGKQVSSFSGSGGACRNLDRPLKDWGSVDTLMRQSTEQLETKSIAHKFIGDIIITPECMGDFIQYLVGKYLGDYCMITGASPYKDKLGQKVASSKLSLWSKPVSGEIQEGYYFTPDGFEAEDCVVIDKGVLKTFMLSLYGANKTGKSRAPNAGGCWVIETGDSALTDMVQSIDHGLLLCRFSGGVPSENGDFSGVAKNSYLIEKGRIAYPVSEMMVSGNIGKLFESIKSISRERVDSGSVITPWVQAGGITISGK